MVQNKEDDYYRRRRIFWAILVAAAVITAVSISVEAGTYRPLRYYTDSGNTALTYFTNGSGVNISYWGINTDEPLCELDINGTVCINRSGVYYAGVNITPGSDGNNYPTSLAVNQTNGNYTIQLGRNGLSTLSAHFSVNSTGSGGISGITINNGTSINVSGNGTNFSIGVANLQACNAVTEYSVWNGSHWLCDNDGGGTTYTFSNTDELVNLSGSPSLIINLNLTAMDLRYTLRSVYEAFVTTITASAGGWTNTSTQTTTQLRLGVNNTAPAYTLEINGHTRIQDSDQDWTQRTQGLEIVNSVGGNGLSLIRSNSSYMEIEVPGGTPTATRFLSSGTTAQQLIASTLTGTTYSLGDVGFGANNLLPVLFVDADRGSVCVNCNTTTSNLTVVGNASIDSTLNAPNLVLTNTNAGRTEVLRTFRPGTGGLYITAGGGSPISAQIGGLSSSLTTTNPLSIYLLASGNYGAGDMTLGNGGGGNQPTIFVGYNRTQTGFNTSAPNATVHVVGTANITQIHSEQICLNSDCRTAWPTGGSGGGNFSEFRVSNGTSTTTLYNNSQLTLTAGSNVVVDQTAGTFTISASVTGGSGNVSGNLTSGYVPLANSANTLTTSTLFQNTTETSISTRTFNVNGYNIDRSNPSYFYASQTEFCEVGASTGSSIQGFRPLAVSSGSAATGGITGNMTHPCITSILDSTTAGGGWAFYTGTDSFQLNGTENGTAIWKRSSNTKPGQVTVRHGFLDQTGITEPVNGCYWQFNFTTTTNVAYTQCRTNSVPTLNATTYTPTNDTWYITNVAINTEGTRALFYLYDENGNLLLNTTVSTVPTASNRNTGYAFTASENNVSAASNIVHIDYLDLFIRRNIRRLAYLGG